MLDTSLLAPRWPATGRLHSASCVATAMSPPLDQFIKQVDCALTPPLVHCSRDSSRRSKDPARNICRYMLAKSPCPALMCSWCLSLKVPCEAAVPAATCPKMCCRRGTACCCCRPGAHAAQCQHGHALLAPSAAPTRQAPCALPALLLELRKNRKRDQRK